MPARQIRKYKMKARSHSKSRSSKNYNNIIKLNQQGGEGSFVLPPAYFGKGSSGYYPSGSSELNSGRQHSVSQGVISPGGKMAGPNVYPGMGMIGGNCGCSGRRNAKSKKSKKSKNLKSMKGGYKSKTRKYTMPTHPMGTHTTHPMGTHPTHTRHPSITKSH